MQAAASNYYTIICELISLIQPTLSNQVQSYIKVKCSSYHRNTRNGSCMQCQDQESNQIPKNYPSFLICLWQTTVIRWQWCRLLLGLGLQQLREMQPKSWTSYEKFLSQQANYMQQIEILQTGACGFDFHFRRQSTLVPPMKSSKVINLEDCLMELFPPNTLYYEIKMLHKLELSSSASAIVPTATLASIAAAGLHNSQRSEEK